MGQASSQQAQLRCPSATPADQVVLPLSISSPCKTTVLELGAAVEGGGESGGSSGVWHVSGGRRVFPFRPGYRASCEAYGERCSLAVEGDGAGTLAFVMHTEGGREFRGSTPTAPFARLALSLRRLDVVNGLEAFGFLNPLVQKLLRGSTQPDSSEEPGSPLLSRLVQGATANTAAAQLLRLPQSRPASGASGLLPSAAPPLLQSWLDLPPQPHLQLGQRSGGAPDTPNPQGLEISILPASQYAATRLPGLSAPPPPVFASRPGSAAGASSDGQAAATGDALTAHLAARAPARRRRPGSAAGRATSGKGWTAFTAFGLEQRAIVRAEAPWASATEVEKMVGQKWAALSQAEKQRYAEAAARVRRQGEAAAPGGAGSRGARPLQSEGREQAYGSAGGGGGGMKRSRSDAASALAFEDRPQRSVRRSRHYSDDYYDWSGIDEVGAPAGSDAESEGAEEEEEEVVEEELLAELEAQQRQEAAGRRGAGPPPGAPRARSRASQRSPSERDEGAILGLLASMCEQAMAASPTPSPAAPLPAATQPPGLAPAMQQQKQQLAAPETTAAEACATAAQRAQQAAAETPLSPFAQQLQLTLPALS